MGGARDLVSFRARDRRGDMTGARLDVRQVETAAEHQRRHGFFRLHGDPVA